MKGIGGLVLAACVAMLGCATTGPTTPPPTVGTAPESPAARSAPAPLVQIPYLVYTDVSFGGPVTSPDAGVLVAVEPDRDGLVRAVIDTPQSYYLYGVPRRV